MKKSYTSPLIELQRAMLYELLSSSDNNGFDLVDNEGTSFEDWADEDWTE